MLVWVTKYTDCFTVEPLMMMMMMMMMMMICVIPMPVVAIMRCRVSSSKMFMSLVSFPRNCWNFAWWQVSFGRIYRFESSIKPGWAHLREPPPMGGSYSLYITQPWTFMCGPRARTYAGLYSTTTPYDRLNERQRFWERDTQRERERERETFRQTDL